MDFIELIPKKPAPPARRTKFFPILGTLLTIVLVAYFSLPLLGKWLVREDPIHPVDAIAVLSGHFPQRAIEAVHLYRQGYAREIWLTFPKSRGIVDRAGKFHPNSEDLLNFALLRGFGVPTQAIRVLETKIVNTADELNAIDAGLKEIGGTSVIIVTNKAHTRRVFSLWDKYHFLDGQVLIHAVSDDQFAPSRWWKSASSRAQAIHELLGNLNVWADMPVRRPLPANSNLGSIFWFMYSTTR